jgi:hypothetical protein
MSDVRSVLLKDRPCTFISLYQEAPESRYIPGAIVPALLTRMSIFPSFSRTCSTALDTLASFVTSSASLSMLVSLNSAIVSRRRELA